MQQITRTFCFLSLLTLTVINVCGNAEDAAEWRTWTSVKLFQLVEHDRMFIAIVPEEKGSTQIAGLDAIPGVISEPITCKRASKWSYHPYLPEDFHDGREWTAPRFSIAGLCSVSA